MEQKSALDDLYGLLLELIAPGDTELQLRVDAITVVTGTIRVLAVNPEGRYATAEGPVNSPALPGEVFAALERLRAAMYREGAGTWFSARISVTPHGSARAEFDYDGEPRWDVEPSPSDYVADLARFPRDADHMPSWLAARLAGTQPPPVDRDALVAYGRDVFSRVTDPTGLRIVDLPDGLGVAVIHPVRGGGKLFIAPDLRALYSGSAQSFDAGLDAFRSGRRSSPEQLGSRPQP